MMDFTKTVVQNIPCGIKQPRRAQIYVGFRCHQKCGFCYYKTKCNEEMFEFDYVKKQIDFEYEYGIRDFEITGGEPSEYKYLREVCEYIKSKDSKSKIAIITNGGLWNRGIWDVIDEVLLSYHLSEKHDKTDMTMFPGVNPVKKCQKTVEMARNHDVLLRTNTVLGTFNIENLPQIVDDLIRFKPTIINFLPVNLFDEAKNMVNFIDYRKLRPIIKTQIDRIKIELIGTLVFIRYMPFCDMIGYEQHIVGHLQHIYDWFDWNRELDGTELLTHINKSPNDLFGRYGSKSVQTCFSQRDGLYEKSPKCMFCRYNIICDGVEKMNGKLLDQIVPTPGVMIKNPIHFTKTITQELYESIYSKTWNQEKNQFQEMF